jgi:hypothetical protein
MQRRCEREACYFIVKVPTKKEIPEIPWRLRLQRWPTDICFQIKMSKQMTKRILRVTKWLGMTPAVATCAACGQEFKAPMDSLRRTKDAQENLQGQFDRHACQPNTPV